MIAFPGQATERIRSGMGQGSMAWRFVQVALRLYRDPQAAWRALVRWMAADPFLRRYVGHRRFSVGGRQFTSLYVPGYPSRAFDRFVEYELLAVTPLPERPITLRAAIVAITRRCALRCEHCVEWDTLNQRDLLEAEQLTQVAHQLRDLSVTQVFLSGGEPLQRFNDVCAMAGILRHEADVWVISSGRGLTADRARALREAGITGVVLSLDDWREAEHDRFRGRPGVFAGVRAASGHVVDAGLVLALSLCPRREFVSADNLTRYAALAGSLGATFVQLIEPKAAGRWAGKEVQLGRDERYELERFAARSNEGDLPFGVTYMDWVARELGCRGAGNQYAYIDTAGELTACPFCRKASAPIDGDLGSALRQLWARGCPNDCRKNHREGREAIV